MVDPDGTLDALASLGLTSPTTPTKPLTAKTTATSPGSAPPAKESLLETLPGPGASARAQVSSVITEETARDPGLSLSLTAVGGRPFNRMRPSGEEAIAQKWSFNVMWINIWFGVKAASYQNNKETFKQLPFSWLNHSRNITQTQFSSSFTRPVRKWSASADWNPNRCIMDTPSNGNSPMSDLDESFQLLLLTGQPQATWLLSVDTSLFSLSPPLAFSMCLDPTYTKDMP